MAPNPGEYRVLDWRSNGAWSLVNNDGRHDLVSNVCRHRQAIMLEGHGSLPGGTITCPLHRWSYDGTGKHIGAPEFADMPCLDLPRRELRRWNGVVFDGKRQVRATSPASAWRRNSTSKATCSARSNRSSTTSTGRLSSRSTSRITTSARSTRDLLIVMSQQEWDLAESYSVETRGVT
jgi:nitrite reductase/ring-hydroxylating ferredoxin subunit